MLQDDVCGTKAEDKRLERQVERTVQERPEAAVRRRLVALSPHRQQHIRDNQGAQEHADPCKEHNGELAESVEQKIKLQNKPALVNTIHNHCTEDEEDEESDEHVVDGAEVIDFKEFIK